MTDYEFCDGLLFQLEKISMSNKPKTSVQLNSQTVKVDFSVRSVC